MVARRFRARRRSGGGGSLRLGSIISKDNLMLAGGVIGSTLLSRVVLARVGGMLPGAAHPLGNAAYTLGIAVGGAYVTRRFLLQVDGTTVTPAYVGSEITGGSLWVYQEVPAPAEGAGAALRFNSQILTEVWARQENRVNIGGGTQVNTFVFHAGDAPADAPLTR